MRSSQYFVKVYSRLEKNLLANEIRGRIIKSLVFILRNLQLLVLFFNVIFYVKL